MQNFRQSYQPWLTDLDLMIHRGTQAGLADVFTFAELIRAYLQAGKDLTAYETQLFLETFFRESTSAAQPELWPETFWETLSAITDKTQVEWAELATDLHHQAIYSQGEDVGMGLYCCLSCGESIHYTHPAMLLSCSYCNGDDFLRRG